ncbi:hypothetical protein HMPREF9123_0245 [Neisseria bacilliformis ATCC BAA-1200]|uniref:Uncharacterized protein n=1 Tax=Neisseria bacilliformis ATCC BAA-1200 TaxID=888742 RepID=F2B971_9NEIS|nr:hypothetical protein HMPREF9123_0245 [Neisseria bacilliformis ATCC BAA-1200]
MLTIRQRPSENAVSPPKRTLSDGLCFVYNIKNPYSPFSQADFMT